ncbi:MAG: tetratricopeptide repeat protein [Chryseolinea sp.]
MPKFLCAQISETDSLLNLIPGTKPDTALVTLYGKIAAAFVDSDSSMSSSYARKTLDLAIQLGDEVKILYAQNINGDVLNGRGNFLESQPYFRGVLNSKINGTKASQLLQEANEGLALSFMRLEVFDSSKYFIDQGLEIATERRDVVSQAYLYSILGSLYLTQEDRRQALSSYIKSSELYESAKNRRGLINVINNIGNIEYLLGHFDKAIDYATKAKKLSLRNEMGGYNYSNKLLGRSYRQQKKYEEALAVYRESVAWYEKAGSLHDLGELYLSIGNIYFDQGQMVNALNEYKNSIHAAKKLHSTSLLGAAYSAAATAHVELNHDDVALKYIDSIMAVSKREKDPYPILDGYVMLGSIYERKGDYKKAWESSSIVGAMNDSIVHADNRRIIDDMEAKYQNERKQKEIDNLQTQQRLDQLIVQRQEIIIIAGSLFLILSSIGAWLFYKNKKRTADLRLAQEVNTLNERISETRQLALRLQMNPHFIFNCMSAIDSLIIHQQTKKASTFLTKFAKLLRDILENSQHDTVALEKDIECLELYIQLEQMRFENSFNYEINVDPKLVQGYYEIPPLIFQPYVENAILHGLRHKEGQRHLSITAKAGDEDSVHVIIRDNGVGRDKAKEINAVRPNHQSMGMTITEQRLKLMKDTHAMIASVEILDLMVDGRSDGTEVRMSLQWEASH